MTLDRMKLSAQTVRDNIAIMEECEEPDDAGYYLQLEHEKFVLACIEKQIPKKVVEKKFVEDVNLNYCPCCNVRFIGWGMKHCGECGQALDWSDTE
jgi:hypothetical protein